MRVPLTFQCITCGNRAHATTPPVCQLGSYSSVRVKLIFPLALGHSLTLPCSSSLLLNCCTAPSCTFLFWVLFLMKSLTWYIAICWELDPESESLTLSTRMLASFCYYYGSKHRALIVEGHRGSINESSQKNVSHPHRPSCTEQKWPRMKCVDSLSDFISTKTSHCSQAILVYLHREQKF